MSGFEVPLAYRKLRTTGDVVVHAELIMAIKTDRGTWEPFPFLIDSGTEMTTTAAGDAKHQNLPMPKQPVSGADVPRPESPLRVAAGADSRDGRDRICFPLFLPG